MDQESQVATGANAVDGVDTHSVDDADCPLCKGSNFVGVGNVLRPCPRLFARKQTEDRQELPDPLE